MKMQPAEYVFKLRQNISIEDDLRLASWEISSFFADSVEEVFDVCAIADRLPELKEFTGLARLDSHTRMERTKFYACKGPLALLPELVRKTTFVQHLYCTTEITKDAASMLKSMRVLSGPAVRSLVRGDTLVILAVPYSAIFEFSGVVARRSADAGQAKRAMDLLLLALLGQSADKEAMAVAESALTAHNTSAYLTHGIHYYKAKSFPRMVRALINIGANQVHGKNHRVIDNFVGSGTTLLESSLLGIPSVGIDIDPLSALISRTKVLTLGISSDSLEEEVKRISQLRNRLKNGQTTLLEHEKHHKTSQSELQFPIWLLKNRKMTPDVADELKEGILALRNIIDQSRPDMRTLLQILMSDAISRKIHMRILGTGSGRFSLSFARAALDDIFMNSLRKYSRVTAISEWLQENLDLELAASDTIVADARDIPVNSSAFDILVTSPPYLPASSGRESYAKSRALSIIALGMADRSGVDILVDKSVGSMNNRKIAMNSLNADEQNLVDWLSKDKLRAPKAIPTARYFVDMRQAFVEMYRILAPGAIAFVIVGKQSTFYRFETREPLYVVQFADMVRSEAEDVGFICENSCDIQLKKKSSNARPRSLDDYYESIIVLRKR